MLFILEEGGNFDFESLSSVKKVGEISNGICIFEKNNEVICLKQITPILWQLAFDNKYSFDKGTPDFENKDYFFYKYKVWKELENKTQKFDMSDFYKC